MQQMNFIKAEKQYKSILENCGNYSSQFMINLLNNYSICLLNQRKFEESANYATKIILEYDNKNKRAYLTMLIILYNIKEYKKALEKKLEQAVSIEDYESAAVLRDKIKALVE